MKAIMKDITPKSFDGSWGLLLLRSFPVYIHEIPFVHNIQLTDNRNEKAPLFVKTMIFVDFPKKNTQRSTL